jgi:hypothetical protein
MRLSVVVRLNRIFFHDTHHDTEKERHQFVLRQLTFMTVWCRITTLELDSCAIIGPHAEWLAGGVLVQCRALVHLDLSENGIGPAGTESLEGVLGQCTALAHLNLRENQIGEAGVEWLTVVLT